MRSIAITVVAVAYLMFPGHVSAQNCDNPGYPDAVSSPSCPTTADSTNIVVYFMFPNTCYQEPTIDSVMIGNDSIRIFAFVHFTPNVPCLAVPVFFTDTIAGGQLAANRYPTEIVTTIDSGLFAGTYACPDSISVYAMGDATANLNITAADIIYLVNHIFRGGEAPCGQMGDTNCDSALTSADIIYLVNYIFKSGPPPVDPCYL